MTKSAILHNLGIVCLILLAFLSPFIIVYSVVTFLLWDPMWVANADAGGRFGFLLMSGVAAVLLTGLFG